MIIREPDQLLDDDMESRVVLTEKQRALLSLAFLVATIALFVYVMTPSK